MSKGRRVPPAFAAFGLDAADRASTADRIWFEQHPRATERIRFGIRDELPGVTTRHMVQVLQLRPGIRLRSVLPEVYS